MAQNPSARLVAARRLFDQNHVSPAESELLLLLAEEPNNVEGVALLGAVFARQGRLPDADRLLSAVVQAHPQDPFAIGWLGILRKSQNNFQAAVVLFQRLIQLGQADGQTYNHLGLCWLALEDAVAAGDAFKRVIYLDRNAAQGYYNLGMALKLAKSSYEAYSTFKRSSELDPSFLGNYIQVWKQMQIILNWREGLPVLEKGFQRFPSSSVLMVALATVYGKVGDPLKADSLFKAACAIDPTAGPPYAHWLQEEGRFEDSVPILKESIRKLPIQGHAYYNLAVVKCYDLDGKSLVDAIEPIIDEPSLAQEDRMFLYYALAKVYDDKKAFETAMHFYDLANLEAYKLYNSGIKYEPVALSAFRDQISNIYSKVAIDNLGNEGSASTVPIFIVGMIRTGTTLLDQILASHPSISSAGEQPFWQLTAGKIDFRWQQSGGNAADIRDLENSYLKELFEAAGRAPKIVDKMPTNYKFIGLMSIVFPRAKFIHIRRSPLDTCLSIYTTFLGNATSFAYSQENIVNCYRDYLWIMDYWRSVLPPGQMIEIDYEDLVANKEAVLRRVLEFCEVEWDDTVLNHERSASKVNTPSLWTARQPVNTASVERWKRYEPWLGHLLELRDVKHPSIRE